MDVVLTKSIHAQCVRDGENAIIWHSLFGHSQIVSSPTLALLDLFNTPRPVSDLTKEYELSDDIVSAIETLYANHYLISPDFNERQYLANRMKSRSHKVTDGSMIEFLELIMSEACNLRCTYCIHFNNLETSNRISNPTKFMNFTTAKQTVDGFMAIRRQNHKNTAYINFGGGEPLLAWPVIEQVLQYCDESYGHEFQLRYTINTNCTLITREIAEKLKKHKVEIAASLDGLKQANDLVRITKNGKGSFDQIMKGFEILESVGYPLDGFAVTVNERNLPEINEALIDWAVAHNMKEVRIDIDMVDIVDVSLEDIVNKLMQIRRYAKRFNVDVPGFWSRATENLNFATLEENVAFCGAVRGNSMCVSPSGKIYGCGYSNTQLGELVQIGNLSAPGGNYHKFVERHLTGNMDMCRGCMIEGQCAGGCNITIEYATSTNTMSKIDRMCDFYREMTRQLLLEELHEHTAVQSLNA